MTERATLRLLARLPTPGALADARVRTIRQLIHDVGLVDSKARGLKSAARTLVDKFGGVVPQEEGNLLQIPMVGPKTAHAILVFGHLKPGLPVDTHILRVTRRLGVVRGRSIRDAQKELGAAVPEKYWGLLNPILVQHGMNVCRPMRPTCAACPISNLCPRIGVGRERSRRTVN